MNNSEEPSLRRELGLRDLTLFAITIMVGTRWLPAAAHAGPGSITLWLLAALLLAVPLAIATAVLTVKYPGAGGLYEWTRQDFGPWHGFLAFWIYWMGIAFWFPSAAMFYMSTSAYMLGPSYAHLADSRTFVLTLSLSAIWIALGTNLVGMKIGKWTENLGGVATWTIGVLLIVFMAIVWMKRGSATRMNIMPHWDWNTVNFWASIAYAMTGIELAGNMGSEVRDPERTLPRAAAISSLFATLFYALTTMALLVFLAPGKISELNGLAQGSEVVAQVLHVSWITPMFALLVLATAVGGFGGMGTSVSRMPFAAGVDSLLPAAFGKIHPRWGTPYVSLLVLGAVATFLLVAIQLGDTMRAAYQELVSLMVIAGFLPYVYIFASSWKAGKRISALSGWGMTALALVCSVVPTADVKNVWLFEGKLAIGTIAVIASAWYVFRLSQQRRIAPVQDPQEV